MKKLSIFLMSVIAGWSLTSCNEDFNNDHYVMPTVYPQEKAIVIEGFEATPTAAASENINIATLVENGIDSIQLFTLTQGTLPEGVTLNNIRLEAWPADTTENVATKVEATEDGMVTRDELVKLVYTFYGKKSTERVFSAKLLANAYKNQEAQLITLGDFTLKITPEQLENPYYYIYGNVTNSKKEEAYKTVMTPDPTSDVVYTYTSRFVSSGDLKVWNSQYWKEGQATNDFTKLYGSGEKSAFKGTTGTVVQGKNASIFSPTKEYYTFKINLETLTYEWIKLENQDPDQYTTISLIGLNGDWNTDVDMESTDNVSSLKKSLPPHNWYAKITITVAGKSVKFRADHDWKTNWGYGSKEGDWTVSDDNWAKSCTQEGANIILPVGTYHVYFCDITGAAHFVLDE